MSDTPKAKRAKTSFWFDESLLNRLRKAADREGRSVSNMLSRILDEGLASRERKKRAAQKVEEQA